MIKCKCGSNDFQDYFDDVKKLRVKQVPKNQASRIKFQNSRFKNNQDQDSRFKRRNREATVKTSQGKYFSKIQT